MKKSNCSLDSSSSRGSGFFSRVAKSRKNNNTGSLPVPMHQRTVSSPVPLIETTSPDALPINHKRYPSSVDHRAIDASDRLSFKHDSKKLSLDSHLSVDKSPKRTSSDTTDKHSKKNFINDKLLTKRSLDEIRIPKPSADKNFVLNTPETPKMTASPELLAELLKGSSEKLLNEQNHSKKHQNRNNTNNNGMSLPTAVLNSLNSLVSLTISIVLYYVEHVSTYYRRFHKSRAHFSSVSSLRKFHKNLKRSSKPDASVSALTHSIYSFQFHHKLKEDFLFYSLFK